MPVRVACPARGKCSCAVLAVGTCGLRCCCGRLLGARHHGNLGPNRNNVVPSAAPTSASPRPEGFLCGGRTPTRERGHADDHKDSPPERAAAAIAQHGARGDETGRAAPVFSLVCPHSSLCWGVRWLRLASPCPHVQLGSQILPGTGLAREVSLLLPGLPSQLSPGPRWFRALTRPPIPRALSVTSMCSRCHALPLDDVNVEHGMTPTTTLPTVHVQSLQVVPQNHPRPLTYNTR